MSFLADAGIEPTAPSTDITPKIVGGNFLNDSSVETPQTNFLKDAVSQPQDIVADNSKIKFQNAELKQQSLQTQSDYANSPIGFAENAIKAIPSAVGKTAVNEVAKPIVNSVIGGANQIEQGVQEGGLHGTLKAGSGVMGGAYAYLAPVMKYLGEAIGATGNAIGRKSPELQQWVQQNPDKYKQAVNIFQDIQNGSNVLMGLLGLGEGVKGTFKEASRGADLAISGAKAFKETGIPRDVPVENLSPESGTPNVKTETSSTPNVKTENAGDVTSEQTKPIKTKANNELKTRPVLENGNRITKGAYEANLKRVQDGMKELPPEELAQYKVKGYKDSAENLAKLKTTEDPAVIKKMAVTGENIPSNISPEILFNDVRREAEAVPKDTRDYQLLSDLQKSPIHTKISESAQSLGAHGYNKGGVSTVDYLDKANKTVRIKAKIEKTTPVIKAKISRAAARLIDYNKIIDKITC